ncbi:MAG: ABC transporter permease, partial [Cyclobacteriaceae bacterium]
MISNYVKLALRNMRKYRMYAFINILGLAIGMAATILILLFIKYELSYDAYHSNADRIYRVSREWVDENGKSQLHLGHVAPPIGPLLDNDFEGVIEYVGRIMAARGTLVEANGKKFEEDNFFFGENDIFSIFSWNFISGDPQTALEKPGSMVITAAAAKRYFGDVDVVGEQMIFNNFGYSFPFQITGVVSDIPANSHFTWDFMASFRTVEQAMGDEEMQNWGSNNYSTYIMLEKDNNIAQVENKIDDFFDEHLGVSEDGEKPSKYNRLHFWPVKSIHLHSHLDSEIEANGDISYVYIYGIIALFTLAIASINFMNLSTAQSSQRSREVGMRKVLGAVKPALIGQFLVESVLFALFGLVLAFGIIAVVLPYVNDFFQRELSID